MKSLNIFFIMLAGILWGVISIFVKSLNSFGISSVGISSIRCFLTAIILFLYILISNPSAFKIRLKDIWIFIGTGIISLTLFNICYFYTIEHAQASVAVILLYTSPVFVMLFSKIFFKEKINSIKVLSLVLCICGCVFITGVLSNKIPVPTVTFITGICSGLFYALYSIFDVFALRKYSVLTSTFYTFLFASIMNISIYNPVKLAGQIFSCSTSVLMSIGIAVISTLIPYLLYSAGLKKTPASIASVLVTTEPLAGAVIGIAFYHDSVDFLKIIGMFLILTSVIILALNTHIKKYLINDSSID